MLVSLYGQFNLLETPGKFIWYFATLNHRYHIYTRWCIPHCGQAKIEARSQALVVPPELTWSMIICVFCISEMDKVDNKSSFMQLQSI